jgi:hypothetical protein
VAVEDASVLILSSVGVADREIDSGANALAGAIVAAAAAGDLKTFAATY